MGRHGTFSGRAGRLRGDTREVGTRWGGWGHGIACDGIHAHFCPTLTRQLIVAVADGSERPLQLDDVPRLLRLRRCRESNMQRSQEAMGCLI